MGNAAPAMDAVPGLGADFSVSHLFYNTFLQSAIAKKRGLAKAEKSRLCNDSVVAIEGKRGYDKEKKGCFRRESGNFEKEKC